MPCYQNFIAMLEYLKVSSSEEWTQYTSMKLLIKLLDIIWHKLWFKVHSHN